MTVRSSLYVGSVMHRRLHPVKHRFRYRAFWLLLDLDELTQLSTNLKWFSYNRSNLFSFYDADHGDGSDTPIRLQIERLLGGTRTCIPGGRIQVLCMPRTLGYCFNPLSIFFCCRPDGALAAVVYQVHNTFGERHSYVIEAAKEGGPLKQGCQKLFHVSPFMDMDMRYSFRIGPLDDRLAIGIRSASHGRTILIAVLAADRLKLTDANLLRLFLRMPAIGLKVIAAIHWEALRLWTKGLRPRKRPPLPDSSATIVPLISQTLD